MCSVVPYVHLKHFPLSCCGFAYPSYIISCSPSESPPAELLYPVSPAPSPSPSPASGSGVSSSNPSSSGDNKGSDGVGPAASVITAGPGLVPTACANARRLLIITKSAIRAIAPTAPATAKMMIPTSTPFFSFSTSGGAGGGVGTGLGGGGGWLGGGGDGIGGDSASSKYGPYPCPAAKLSKYANTGKLSPKVVTPLVSHESCSLS
mmetsp:Transcript_4876/g.5712  ORF Transcript_4876/g.5712 Transcript_4876/m.5712 type:complete len:206 (-) Transcript_4876:6417-7034(-)